jgi:UDP-glucuronate decarboxylase
MRPLRVLVTGGAGFLGSHLVEKLLHQGSEVVVLDNFFTGSRENLRHVLSHPHLEVIRHDVIEPVLIETDQIYNLACPASPVHYQFNPIKTVQTNVMGTLNLLSLCSRLKGRFLQASTSEVYGDPIEHPQTEGYWGNVNPIGIRSCYDEGKRVAETLCMDYHRQNGVQVRIARIFNTYGPRMAFDDGRVVSNFIIQALRNQPITIYGDGQQTRSFCYVDDLVDGLYRLMNVPDPDFTGPLNIGNPGEFSMLELAQMVIELTDSSSTIERHPLPSDDPRQRQPDITKARQVLDWEPKTALRAGLTRTIASFRERLH